MYRFVKWDITNNCNLNCKHCYNAQERTLNSNDAFLSNQQVFNIINKLSELNVTKLHLLGGEPLLSPNIITILSYANQKNIKTSFTTNGMLLSESMIEALLNYNIDSITVSLEGVKETDNDNIRGKNVLRTVKENIQKLVNAKNTRNNDVSIYLSLTLNKYNKNSSTEILRFVDELCLDGLLISRLEKEGLANDNWSKLELSLKEFVLELESLAKEKKAYPNLLLEIDCKSTLSEYLFKKYGFENTYFQLSENFCNGGDEEFYLKYDGTFLPCRKVATDAANDAIKNGNYSHKNLPNIFHHNSEEIKNSEYLSNFYNYTRNIDVYQNVSTCSECKYNTKCKPCPLTCETSSIIEECEYARSLLTLLDKQLLNSNIRVNKSIKKSTLTENQLEILNFNTQEKYMFDSLSADIFHELENSQNKNLNEIISKLYKEYNSDIEKNDFITDILEFVYDLMSKELIYLDTI